MKQDTYASDGLPIRAVANPNTAWLREVTVGDLYWFIWKVVGATAGVGALLSIPAIIILMVMHN